MFGLILKQLREQRGLSQRDLAKQLGLSQGAVGMWESGKREPGFDTVKRLAVFFDVSTDHLLGKTDTAKAPPCDPVDEDAGDMLDDLITKLEGEETIQFDGYSLDRNTAELLKKSLSLAEETVRQMLKNKQ